jgi:hypothetical protein
MPYIKVNGKTIKYATFEDRVKPLWKEKMRKQDLEQEE